MNKQQNHCRCTLCGFIRYYNKTMEVCPKCGNREQATMVPSFNNKQEALVLFCKTFGITTVSEDGCRIKQALDIIMDPI